MEPKVIDYSNAFLKLNISGKRYKILKSTALRLRNSLFAELVDLEDAASQIRDRSAKISPAAASSFFLIDAKEFFLERPAVVFDYVLNYVFSGKLHCPVSVCKEMLVEEMKFWRLVAENRDETRMAPCCFVDETEMKNEKKMEEKFILEKPSGFLGRIWLCCEEPSSSTIASWLNIASIFFIILSIVNLILSTMKSLQHCPDSNGSPNGDGPQNVTLSKFFQDRQSFRCEGGPIFDIIETTCIAWFTLELLVRFVACPRKRKFFKSPLNIIDILSTVPFYIELVLWSLNLNTGKLVVIYVFRLLRILRITRALKLARYFDSIRMMGEVFKKCLKDLTVLLVFTFMAMIISSSIVYYFERDEENTQFTSIPAAFWWCIVTLTTVGYGDITPSTPGGRICAGAVCIAGIILMAMPISIMVEQFGKSYKSRVIKHKHADVMHLFHKNSKKISSEEQKILPNDDWKDEEGGMIFVPKKRDMI